MTKKKIAYMTLPLLGLGLVLGTNAVTTNAFGGFGASTLTPEEVAARQTDRFQHEATLLGVSVDTVKDAWAKGETLLQLAEANGITQEQLQQKLQDERTANRKTHLQELVTQGVITQAQADARLQFMETQTHNEGQHGKRGGMGFGMGGMRGGF